MEPAVPPKSRKWLGWARDIALALLLVMVFQWWQARNLVHGVAPDISGQLLDGQPVSLANYTGQPVLIHFWATWCPVCRLEEDAINSIAKDYPVLTLAHASGSRQEVLAYMSKQALSFPVMLDESGELGQRWGVTGVPASFVLDGEGKINSIAIGYTTEIGLRLRMWLAGK